MFIIRLLKNYYKNFNIIRVYTFLKHAIFPIFYMYTKDFAKQRYNTPYACNVI